MKTFPSIPRVANAPDDLFEEGHLWVLEKVDGANFRFQLQESGLLHFGDWNTVYDDPTAVPEPYQHAVRHVQTTLDRGALRGAVDSVADVVFFGEAMHRHTIDYDWDRTPSFLGFDVWSDNTGGFLDPGVAAQVFERLNLRPVNAIERELPARDFDPDRFEIPRSAWYDGPAEGVVIRNKRDQRAKLLHPEFQEADESVPVNASATDLAAKFATDHRFEKSAAKLEDNEIPVTFETLYDRVLEDIIREEHKQLYHGTSTVEMDIFRSEVAALTRKFVDEK
ncbi:RNA ligase family protein [Salinibaculum salinum]|uniref:RNA ligase family protein n=1 Tax=Salinibaculum salinum TaxID=3131996 RepID=UPI0030EE74A4